MVIGMPIFALLLFPLVANFSIKNINLTVVDNSHTPYSQRLIHKVAASGYFRLVNVAVDYEAALYDVEQDISDIILEIPPHFEEN